MAVDMKTESRSAKKRGPEGLSLSHLSYRLELSRNTSRAVPTSFSPACPREVILISKDAFGPMRRIAPFAQRRWWRGRGPAGGEGTLGFRDLGFRFRELGGGRVRMALSVSEW